MKKIVLAVAVLAALSACKQDTTSKTTSAQRPAATYDSGPSVTMVGPRMGFDGRIRIGGISPGIGLY